ncbi:MAG: outer spore coat protein CotE [Bacillota bacterium]
MSDIRLHEIVTRAVVGRGDRRVVWSHTAPAEGADSVLGVHLSQVRLNVEDESGEASLRLSVVCDLWCSHGDETRVQRLTCTHTEPATIDLEARVVGETTTRASLVRSVRCTEAAVEDGQLVLGLEATVAIEVTGLARFWIKTYDLAAGLDADGESFQSFTESSSASSTSETTGACSEEDEESELEEEAILAAGEATGTAGEEETGLLDDLASLAGSPLTQPAPPQPLLSEPPKRSEAGSTRRATVISHFQQSTGSSRVSIIQGY